MQRGGSRFSDNQIMEIKISEQAQNWFENELGIASGKGVRFLGKVYGDTQVHEGFSVGIDVDSPIDPIGITEINGIPYFVEAGDNWFFSGYNLEVGFDESTKEPEYIFHEIKE